MVSRVLSILTMFCAAVSFTAVTALPVVDRGMSQPYSRSFDFDNEMMLFSRATWGRGKYTIDLDTYHREVKPLFLSEFKKLNSFTSLCGSNPDFEIERDGTVYPNATGAAKKSGKCTKNKFSLNLGHLVLEHQAPSSSSSSSGSDSEGEGTSKGKKKGKRSIEDDLYIRSFEDDLYARFANDDEMDFFVRGGTWGKGKYTVDLDHYHREIKPKFISEFSKLKGFTSLCGSNPDFEIEKDGTVYPNATGAAKKTGKCTKSKFSLDLGHLVV